MRCFPGRWLWGLIPVAMLVWIAFLGEHQKIESDLRQRTSERLAEVGQRWAAAGFLGRDGVIDGRAASATDRQKAVQAARQVWGVRSVQASAVVRPPPPRPFSWSAMREPSAVRLMGVVPNERARQDIVQYARTRFPEHSVEDEMVVSGSNMHRVDWQAGVKFAMGQLGRLGAGGQVELKGGELVVKGTARSSQAYQKVRGELAQNLPKGLRLKNDKVLPPRVSPFVWAVEFKGNQLELMGHVPSEAERNKLFAHIKQLFPNATVIDRMKTAVGQPAEWSTAVLRALTTLAELEQGKFALKDKTLTAEGLAKEEKTAIAARTALKRDLPASFAVIEKITFKQPDIPLAKPFVTTVEITQSTIRLAGHVPSESARKRILSALKDTAKTLKVGPARKLVDRATLARGASKGWLVCLRSGIQGLEKLKGGRLVLTDENLKLLGQSSSKKTIEATTALVRAGVNRACNLDAKITLIALPEPNLEWQAEHRNGRLVLSGQVPDEATKAKILAAVKSNFPSASVVDNSKVKLSLSAKWPVVADVGVRLLARLRTGVAMIRAQKLIVEGQAPDTVTATEVKTTLKRDLPDGYSGSDRIEVRSDAMLWAAKEARIKAQEDAKRKARQKAVGAASKPAAPDKKRKLPERAPTPATSRAQKDAAQAAQNLQGDADRKTSADSGTRQGQGVALPTKRPRKQAVLQRPVPLPPSIPLPPKNSRKFDCGTAIRSASKTRINFARGKARLPKRVVRTLNKLAVLFARCPRAKVQILGHADSDGNAERNLQLSQRRADAVARYFAKAGVSKQRIKAVGYGETRPLVPNSSRANKAKNRRIDFQFSME